METMFVQNFGGTNKEYKKVKLASLNLSNLALRVSIDGYQKTLLDIINCQKSGFRRKSVVLILV